MKRLIFVLIVAVLSIAVVAQPPMDRPVTTSGSADADSIKGKPVQDTTGNLVDGDQMHWNSATNAWEYGPDAGAGGALSYFTESDSGAFSLLAASGGNTSMKIPNNVQILGDLYGITNLTATNAVFSTLLMGGWLDMFSNDLLNVNSTNIADLVVTTQVNIADNLINDTSIASAATWNAAVSGLADTSNYLQKSGGTMAGDIDMDGNDINNLDVITADPTDTIISIHGGVNIVRAGRELTLNLVGSSSGDISIIMQNISSTQKWLTRLGAGTSYFEIRDSTNDISALSIAPSTGNITILGTIDTVDVANLADTFWNGSANWNTAFGWDDHSIQNYLDNDDATVDTAAWNAAVAHISNNGSDHSFVDQSIISGAAPTFTGTNFSGTASSLTSGTVTTNANQTGDVTSVGNATTIASGVIVEADLNATAGPTDNYLLSYNQAGLNFTWVAPSAGSGDLLADGSVPMTANWAFGDFDLTGAEKVEADTIVGTVVIQSPILQATGAASGTLTLTGATSGSASISVPDIAGTPAEIQLPTTTGTNGQVLTTNGATPQVTSWVTPAGSGDVSKVGTPVNDQIGVWTGDGTLEGDADLTFDGTDLTVTGAITAGGTITADGNIAVKNAGLSAGNIAMFEDSDDGANYLNWTVPALDSNMTYTYPDHQGLAGYILSNNGSGVLSWVNKVDSATDLADADHGDFTTSGGVATLDANSVDSDEYTDGSIDSVHMADVDVWGKIAGLAGDTAAALRDGDTWTGVHDFGGATSLEIPNSANPTTDANGELGDDTDDAALETWDGTRSVLMPKHKKVAVMLWSPDLLTDSIPILYVDSALYPGGITLLVAELQTSVGGAYTLTLLDFTAADPPVSGGVANSLVVGASDQRVQDATWTDASLAVGEFLYVLTPAIDIDWIRLSVTFYVNDND